MIKEDLISVVSTKTGFSRTVVSAVLESVLSTITEGLVRGTKVRISGFGVFEPKRRAARTGRNPHTGEPVYIPARIMPTFQAGKSLRKAVEREVCNEGCN